MTTKFENSLGLLAVFAAIAFIAALLFPDISHAFSNADLGQGAMMAMAGFPALQHRTRGILSARAETDADRIFAEIRNSVDGFKAHHEKELEGLRREVDRLNASAAAWHIGGGGDAFRPTQMGNREAEFGALASFARNGTIDLGSMLAAMPESVRASMTSQSGPDGGYTVFPTVSDGITRRLFDDSPLRRLARYEQITSGDSFEELDDREESGAAWVGEEEARPPTDTPKLAMWNVPLHEIYASQLITQRLLDDSSRDLGAWISTKIADKFARSEGFAYVHGDGVGKPRGFLSYDTSELGDYQRTRRQLQFVKSGAADNFAAEDPADALRTLVWTLRAPYRSGATWLMNSETASRIDKFKNANGDYIWRDGMTAGAPPSLLGYPVEIDEGMPNVGANAFPVAFGNFQAGYCIVERPGIKLLRDPYTSKPNVNFYAYRRVGGGLTLDDAIKLLKIAV